MKLKPWLYHSHIHLYQHQSMILRKFVQCSNLNWLHVYSSRANLWHKKNCARNKCSGWNYTSELDSWKLPVLLAWSKKLYKTKNFRNLREYLIEQRRWTAESKINRYLSDRVTRFSKYGSELGVCAQEISQSVSRLHKSISPRFQKELSAVHFQNGGSRRRWKHRLLRRFERP